MCEICLHTPHLPGCPEAPEPHSIGRCALCGDPIFVGEEYAEGMDIYHPYCLEDLSVDEWIKLAGMTVQTAGDDDA